MRHLNVFVYIQPIHVNSFDVELSTVLQYVFVKLKHFLYIGKKNKIKADLISNGPFQECNAILQRHCSEFKVLNWSLC